MSTPVCDCPEPCGCYAEGYAQGKDKAYFELNIFDWTHHAKACACEGYTAFSTGDRRQLILPAHCLNKNVT